VIKALAVGGDQHVIASPTRWRMRNGKRETKQLGGLKRRRGGGEKLNKHFGGTGANQNTPDSQSRSTCQPPMASPGEVGARRINFGGQA